MDQNEVLSKLTYKPRSVPPKGWRSSIWGLDYSRSQAAHPALFVERAAPMRLLGLAPGGVCLAADITADAGGLLHRRFTLTPHMAEQYTSLLHFAVGSPRLAVSQHRALWSADFPQFIQRRIAITRSAWIFSL
jgi:hypothetical protein